LAKFPNFETVSVQIANAPTLRDALFVLKTEHKSFGGCDIAYEYLIRGASYVRGDLVSMTTMSRKFTDLYLPAGGPNADPVLENADTNHEPFIVDLMKLGRDKKSKYATNKFFSALVKSGRKYFIAYPFMSEDRIGRGILTIMADQAQKDAGLHSDFFAYIGQQFHKSIKQNGQLIRYFNIDDKERHVLSRMADGKTAADIAEELGLSGRSVELRLQSARKKLKARTTTEAVYKAVAYAILPYP
jgi:DNA-binding CsgD family transcriptional regulator